MKQADDGLPVVGTASRELGVRVPPDPNADVDLDEGGGVILNGKGMSVVANWRNLLPHLVPKRLRPVFPGAAGSNRLACFRLGEGSFIPGSLNDRLSLMLKDHDTRSGNIVPAEPMSQGELQDALAATRAEWLVDDT